MTCNVEDARRGSDCGGRVRATDSNTADEIDLSKFPGDLFQPEPTTWKQISKLPPHLAKCWIKATKDEIRTQVLMGTFRIKPRPTGGEMVCVTLKLLAKQAAGGFLDKLKACLCL